jgi:hypothetical protein
MFAMAAAGLYFIGSKTDGSLMQRTLKAWQEL